MPVTDVEISGFRIYYVADHPDFTNADTHTVRCRSGNICPTSTTITDLEEGQVYYFAASTFRESIGVVYESRRSGIISYLVAGEFSRDEGRGCFLEATAD